VGLAFERRVPKRARAARQPSLRTNRQGQRHLLLVSVMETPKIKIHI
jgi:hypothetical protein